MTPRIVEEELWEQVDFPLMIIVTGNSHISKRGALVMGRGAARQMRDRIKDVDKLAAHIISKQRVPKQYGFIELREATQFQLGLGLFQTKLHFKSDALPALVSLSTAELKEFALARMNVSFRMNFPGIGEGNLLREEVEPLLKTLPSNVTVCFKPS